MILIQTDNGPVVVDEPTPSRPETLRPQFAFEWTGSDGATWDLVRGPAYILSGARGFGLPTPQHHRRQSLGHGASHNGLRFPPREVYMPVEIETPDILTADRSFFAGIDPRLTGSLRVTTPQGEWREIVCRYDEGAEGEYEMDPLLRKRAVYPIRMTAEDPFWRGRPIATEFKYAAPSNVSPTRPGPPFYRQRADNLDDSGEVTNPGDVDVRAVWRVEGPFTSFDVGVNDLTVNLAYPKAAGQWVEIDMTAGTSSVVDETGADLRDYASDLDFPSIPVGTSQLTTTVVGAGTGTRVSVSFVPRFLRAW